MATISSVNNYVSDKYALYNSAYSSSKISYKYDATKKTNTITQENTINYDDLDAEEKISTMLRNYKHNLWLNSIIDEEDKEEDIPKNQTLEASSKMSEESYKKALSVNKDKSKDKKTTDSISTKEDKDKDIDKDKNNINQNSKTNLYKKESEKVETNNYYTTKKTLEYSQGISTYNKNSNKKTDTNSFTITV